MMQNKARILFVAYDVGGGNLLIPVAEKLSNQYDISFIAKGSAQTLWHNLDPINVTNTSLVQMVDLFNELSPQVVVTGTSIGNNFEQTAWLAAREIKCPSIAMIDGWARIAERFQYGSINYIFPDKLGVVDQDTADIICNKFHLSTEAIHIIGHPHLQHVISNVRQGRNNLPNHCKLAIVFFSAPIVDNEADPGITTLMQILPILEKYFCNYDLIVKPHPREQKDAWYLLYSKISSSTKMNFILDTVSSATELLKIAFFVIGLPTSVMLESVLSKIPTIITLFIPQLGLSTVITNNLKDMIVNTPEELELKLLALLNIESYESNWFHQVITDADYKAVKAIQSLIK